MGLESGQFISDLDAAWPLGGDTPSQGDDHLRTIKQILQTQFPGSGGGFSEAITATEEQINDIPNLKTQFNAPAGTALLFHNDNPPTGWLRWPTGGFDHMIRLVDELGVRSGGTDSPITAHSHVVNAHAHTTAGVGLTADQNGPHDHQVTNYAGIDSPGLRIVSNTGPGESGTRTSYSGSGSPHYHGNTGASAPGTAASFSPKYVNVILCYADDNSWPTP